MKKIEAIIKPEKVRLVLDQLKAVGVIGVTVVSEKGQGSGARPLVRDARGTALYTAEYNTMNSVITVVHDSMVDDVLNAIARAVVSGSTGSGKVFVYPVDDVLDLKNGQRGLGAL